MMQKRTRIVSNQRLTTDCFRLTLDNAAEIAREIRPGQFVNLRITGTMDPLFRRPFAVFKTTESDKGQRWLEIVYRVVGKGTRIMATMVPGDELDIVGPCGTGFRFEENRKTHVLLAGGIGVSSLYMMGEQILKIREHNPDLHVFLGAETRDDLILVDEFENLTSGISISTDDGTEGFEGMITELFEKSLEKGKVSSDCSVYGCGPEPMYRALRPICEKYSISAQVSIERRMACGMGVCLSCVCKIEPRETEKHRVLSDSFIQFAENDEFGFALTCMDGPVFHLQEVILDE